MIEKISLKNYNADFRNTRDMETALVWNALKSHLEKCDKSLIFPYIKSIKIGEQSITISSKKPIVNQELKILEEDLRKVFEVSLKPLREFACEKIYFN